MLNRRRLSLLLLVGVVTVASTAADEPPSHPLPDLSAEVSVYFDGHDVPHIYAQSWPDAARVLGVLHAQNRLWQMDMFRRRASGTVAEVVGPSGLESDILMRQLGIRRGCQELWESDLIPAALRAEIAAYTAGVNSVLAALGKDELPPPFQALGYEPRPWMPVDCLVFAKYMGWDQSGTDDDLWFGMMVDRLGMAAVEELWPLERPYEIPTVRVQAERPPRDKAARLAPLGEEYGRIAAAWSRRIAAGRLDDRQSFGSNNWAVDGTKTASGKPILANDPHLGFQLPSIWYTCHLSVGGDNLAGVTFPGSPVVVIGHNDHAGWGLTNMQADAVDFYIETLHESDPRQYRHRGEWKRMERLTEEIAVRGELPHIEQIDYTVHGPIVRRDDRAIAMQWTGQGPTREVIALWKLGRARGLEDFLAAMELLDVPAMNLCYADAHGNIAIFPAGTLPVRMRGQGRVPMDGASGENDWIGWIPRDELPLAVNPAEGFVASANGRPMPLGYPYYLGWMWDPSYRTRRIHDMLSAADGLTVETMAAIQTDVYDKAAERFLPVLVAAVDESQLEDELSRRALAAAREWDFVADRDSVAPAIWLRWFQHYRDGVWQDEWTSRGIEQPGGSWGFTGDNRREPMLEVLEFMTREHPDSIWFDDRTTPQRETRDDIAARAFKSAIASLREQFGENLEDWAWGKHNLLRIGSLSGEPSLARGGQSVVGDMFTVNPGGNIGRVGGGASWRMIVDFARVDQSVGVYPGGQSADPASPFYADQLDPWAEGRYLPLSMVGDPAELPAEARIRRVTFVPAP